MQICVISIRSGYEKRVGGKGQEIREHPVINGGDELPDTMARETLAMVRMGRG